MRMASRGRDWLGYLQVVLAVSAHANVVVALVALTCLAAFIVGPVHGWPILVVGHNVLGVRVPERRHPLRVVTERNPALEVVATAHRRAGACGHRHVHAAAETNYRRIARHTTRQKEVGQVGACEQREL